MRPMRMPQTELDQVIAAAELVNLMAEGRPLSDLIEEHA